ncbi:DUF3604 domain-containing protein [Pseudarthrobacter sp. NamE2]|uniref:DUF3604 domain-containing protein n=1 Tax=Pseudarthrobacter sp. NamE2 TaxID=2576838 RepID=UPI0010FE7FC1|nr:DUF3604 domain-containing protein [Pseudarthrobacter sp. NamE2]TLM86266.1 DUF3604 domain-containing protein [Pseudarthrobacter sp. NamE2]
MALARVGSSLEAYAGMLAYAGDIHNHCDISYGHGSIEEAYVNARLQLDFASVTGHASWHDMPDHPSHVREYHSRGFAHLRDEWDRVQEVTESVHEDGQFVTLLSFEWHSMQYGDHCIYYKSGQGPLAPASARSLEQLRRVLRKLKRSGLDALAIPHHIGYKSGRRGINWETYSEEFSPVVEMLSMHGCGESDVAPRPYLHTMGPRDTASTAQYGLHLGRIFGFIGSTDHHSAHPGSHGYGRAMVWADELTRDGIWNALRARRTYAATGDRIMVATSVNGFPMGAAILSNGKREIAIDVMGGDAIDYVELVRNGEVIARTSPAGTGDEDFDGVLSVTVGWGEIGVKTAWDVELEVLGGRITAVEPRLHGNDVVAPSNSIEGKCSFSAWRQIDDHRLVFSTETRGNPTVMTDATQQLALHVTGDDHTVLLGKFNGVEMRHSIAELLQGSRAGYTGGFLSGGILIHRASPRSSRQVQLELLDSGTGGPRDWYYVRVRQHNDQYAWSSPTWVDSQAR